jgi:hypothetical protein
MIILTLALASIAFAADPRLGTWKLNIAQSKFPPTQPAVKELTMTWQPAGSDQYECIEKVVPADGPGFSVNLTMPSAGGIAVPTGQPGPKGQSVVITILGLGDWYFTYLQDNKQVRVAHSVVSKDGKTIRNTIKGVDPKGNTFEALHVYDKQ